MRSSLLTRAAAQIIWARVYTADALIEALVNVRRRIAVLCCQPSLARACCVSALR
jgi:hypothetical protein